MLCMVQFDMTAEVEPWTVWDSVDTPFKLDTTFEFSLWLVFDTEYGPFVARYSYLTQVTIKKYKKNSSLSLVVWHLRKQLQRNSFTNNQVNVIRTSGKYMFLVSLSHKYMKSKLFFFMKKKLGQWLFLQIQNLLKLGKQKQICSNITYIWTIAPEIQSSKPLTHFMH